MRATNVPSLALVEMQAIATKERDALLLLAARKLNLSIVVTISRMQARAASTHAPG